MTNMREIFFSSFKDREFFLRSAVPRAGGENQLHSTICQLPLETFNSNRIYGSSFQRILPARFISSRETLNATIVSHSLRFDWVNIVGI